MEFINFTIQVYVKKDVVKVLINLVNIIMMIIQEVGQLYSDFITMVTTMSTTMVTSMSTIMVTSMSTIMATTLATTMAITMDNALIIIIIMANNDIKLFLFIKEEFIIILLVVLQQSVIIIYKLKVDNWGFFDFVNGLDKIIVKLIMA